MRVAAIPLVCPKHGLRAAGLVEAEQLLTSHRFTTLGSTLAPEDVRKLRAAIAKERVHVDACPTCRAAHLYIAVSARALAGYLEDDRTVIELDEGSEPADRGPG